MNRLSAVGSPEPIRPHRVDLAPIQKRLVELDTLIKAIRILEIPAPTDLSPVCERIIGLEQTVKNLPQAPIPKAVRG